MEETQKVHIIYVTNQCNLKCPYCYEQENRIEREKKIATKEEIDKALEQICIEEPNLQSTLCVMGGEPLLQMDSIMYIFNKCKEFKESKNKDITINIISNGTLIHKYVEELRTILLDNTIFCSLDVSYDGTKQYVRTPNSHIVEDNLKLLMKEKIPFGLSFTITESSCDKKEFLKELILMLEQFYPDVKYNEMFNSKIKIRINFARREIEESLKSLFIPEKYIEEFHPISKYIYEKYKVSICEFTCNECKKCHKDNFVGKQYYIPKEKDFVTEEMVTEKTFNHF